jgi:hypothetical protein
MESGGGMRIASSRNSLGNQFMTDSLEFGAELSYAN